ncbi:MULTISPECIES: hypothetical protein [Methanocorpusculum]|jgi:hypothetical protein|uniref:Uncharacterized protein n=1 Tax=Methanocorpusculum parvum TaxID=2193 RepID=A0AAX0Q7A9_9EURY|nr:MULTISPECIES: hypothetical protein [Methanocorpusculum]MDD2248547.1 hypothetical protein [Methanocorpusculum sp.]MDD2803011.1 hypothetical protein [Methanocorpusculum sp.]MDD4423332.1 hypothetical protein [Methanocorpusculum parvum]MDY3202671.1 hypothetical protein [Methanocorpusculum sp.]MEA5085689.1 hypothetical protein [Methanocorpusculum sp.]
MAPSKTLIAASLLLAWMGTVASIMILARTINIEIFFVLWLIGFLIITEFFVVTTLRPKSARWQRLIGIAGVGIFAFIIIIKIVEIIAK